MIRTIKSIAFRFGLPLLAFALIILIDIEISRLFSFDLNLVLLMIALLIATAWYLGRNPGLLIAFVFEATLVFSSPAPYTTKSVFATINRLVLFISLVLFASARRHAEINLRRQRELLEVTLQSIGDAVIATDLDGKISFVNPTAENLTGWNAAEIAGKPLGEVFKIVNETSRETVESPFTAVVREGLTVGLANHTLLISKDGAEIPIEDSGAPIKDPKGRIVGVIIVFHDVSEHRQAEREREQLLKNEQAARREAELAARLKDEFLATVSHELRTPLSAILGWAMMLKNNNLGEKDIQRALAVIERNAKAQGEIIGDLLDLSQLITGKLRIDKQFVEVAPILRKMSEALRPLTATKSINLTFSLDEKAGFVIGDAERLRQLIWNLALNAIKFTPEGGTVEIRSAHSETDLEIIVSDSGIGIEKDFLPFVFEKFRQGDASTTRTYGGLGLGLSIVRHLVKLHGGEVSVESAGAGKGAVFTVKLPLAASGDKLNAALLSAT